jgi:hypothetical protein
MAEHGRRQASADTRLFERLAIRPENGPTIPFVHDDDLTMYLRKGGDENARFTECGTVVVLMGINGEDYIKVERDRHENGEGSAWHAEVAKHSLEVAIKAMAALEAHERGDHRRPYWRLGPSGDGAAHRPEPGRRAEFMKAKAELLAELARRGG